MNTDDIIISSDQIVSQTTTYNGALCIVSTNDGVKRYDVVRGSYKGSTLEHDTKTGNYKLVLTKDVKFLP